MPKFFKISRMTRLRIKGCIPEAALNGCSHAGLELTAIEKKDPFTIEFNLHSSDAEKAETIAKSCFCDVTVLKGGKESIGFFRRKAMPILFMLVLIALVFWSKFYVWEIEISGNKSVSDGKIMGVLAQCGVEYGAFWPDFSSDIIRSHVLEYLPELSWVTVNMHGSCAKVIVVEANTPPEMVYKGECSNILSDKDAFIISVDTLEGKSVVKPGDAVKVGDTLISGVVESSFSPPRFLHSQGRIKAETNTEFTAVSPEIICKRSYTDKKNSNFALIIGNKRINFYSGSSFSDSFCDKIISVWSPEIKGIIKLPISLVRETHYFYALEQWSAEEHMVSAKLESSLRDCLSRELENGEVLSEKLNFSKSNGLIISTLRARCVGYIGKSITLSDEEIAEISLKFIQKAEDG